MSPCAVHLLCEQRRVSCDRAEPRDVPPSLTQAVLLLLGWMKAFSRKREVFRAFTGSASRWETFRKTQGHQTQ